MRTLFMALMITGLMSTVGVYAASFSGGSTVKTIGGTTAQTVTSPTTGSVDLSWGLTGDDVSSAIVKWTPTTTGVFTVGVDIDGNLYTQTGLAGTGGSLATHTITVSPVVTASAVTLATVSIVTE